MAETNAALTSYIQRLANGIGWTPNTYNNITSNNNANSEPISAQIVGPASPQAIANNGKVTQNSDGTVTANGYNY